MQEQTLNPQSNPENPPPTNASFEELLEQEAEKTPDFQVVSQGFLQVLQALAQDFKIQVEVYSDVENHKLYLKLSPLVLSEDGSELIQPEQITANVTV